MTAIIVRPSPECDQLVTALNNAGLPAVACPMLSFSQGRDFCSLPETLSTLPPSSLVVLVSPRSVDYGNQALLNANAQWPSHINYIAVGKRTAEVFDTCTGLKASFPLREDSEGMLALPDMQDVSGKKVLILRGDSGREHLAPSLKMKGANVNYCEIYQRQWDVSALLSQAKMWNPALVRTLVVTSGQQLTHFDQLISLSDQHWLRQCHILVPSKRIQNQAIELGFEKITIVDSVGNYHLFNTLRDLSTTGLSDD